MTNSPNIVLMVADDHGREAIGCYGNKIINTQHLDGLAADGVIFTNAFCTSASCAASRSVILTGQFNHANGTYGHTHDIHHFSCFDNIVSLPKLLNDAGYRTGCIGKKHFAPESVFPFQQQLGESAYGRDDISMAAACSSFVKEDGPFFLYWCSHNPHRGGGRLESHPCKPDIFGNPSDSFRDDTEQTYSEDEVIVPPFLNDDPETRAELAQYYQSVSRLDRGVGKMLEILKRENKYDNTLIIYISDNGAAFPGSKTTLYEPGMRLPCLVKTPGNNGPRNTCSNTLVSWVDLAPTIMEFANGTSDATGFHGKSFNSVLIDGVEGAEEIYASHTFHEVVNYYPMRVIRTQKFKFIWNIAFPLTYPFAGDLWKSSCWQAVINEDKKCLGHRSIESYLHHDKFELYNLQENPAETINLAREPEYADLVENFCQKLKDFQQQTSDPWLRKWKFE